MDGNIILIRMSDSVVWMETITYRQRLDYWFQLIAFHKGDWLSLPRMINREMEYQRGEERYGYDGKMQRNRSKHDDINTRLMILRHQYL